MKFFFQACSLSLALIVVTGGVDVDVSLSASSITGGNEELPPDHPPPPPPPPSMVMHPTLAKFSSQLRCPYAQEWLTKGAHKAAIDLGLTSQDNKIDTTHALKNDDNEHNLHMLNRRRRVLQEAQEAQATTTVMGSCSFNNQWTGDTCIQFRGEGWTADSMLERCNVESSSTWSEEGCTLEAADQNQAGWCVKIVEGTDKIAIEATSMMITAMSDCSGNKMACETFIGGIFEYSSSGCASEIKGEGEGGGSSSTTDYASSMTPPDNSCMLAPGAIGAAHQAGFSNGYSSTCPGTPAEGSPYMWPMSWSANVETQSMAYGSDDIVFHSKGKVFYRLDNNWKRVDKTYQNGPRLGAGQAPCPSSQIDQEMSEDGILGCKINESFNDGTDPSTTMIHRGSKMYFTTWKNDTNVNVGETDPSLIAECNYMDLVVIGCIRPDWFLDDRGDDTDVQYLGNQHAYYTNQPRLLKQWRKKDFAAQYFVMSMQGNTPNTLANKTDAPIEDTIHWPLILNIPGEGFGDDNLQIYTNHKLLNDDDDDNALFEIVDALLAINGTCPMIGGTSEGDIGDGDGNGQSIGQPKLEVPIPSNFEVDPNSWYSNVYTFSPVWQPPMKLDTESVDLNVDASTTTSSSSSSGIVAVTEEDRVRVESCYDPTTKSVQLKVEFNGIKAIEMGATSELPWMSLGYRISDVCTMNPPDGSDSKIIMIHQSPTSNAPKAYIGSLTVAAQTMSPTAFTSTKESLWPLDQTTGYSDVSVTAPMLSSSSSSSSSSGGSDVAAIERSASIVNPTSVTLSFKQEFDEVPEVMNLMYAIGMSAQLGIHISRGCFDIVDFPTCPSGSSSTSPSGDGIPPRTNEAIDAWKETNTASSVASTTTVLGNAFLFLSSTVIVVTLSVFLV